MSGNILLKNPFIISSSCLGALAFHRFLQNRPSGPILSLSLNVRPCVCPSVHLFIFKASALWADAFYKLICPSVCVFVRLFVCPFTFKVPFKRLFAPTSKSRMSSIFRDSESLGKNNGKKWSQIWTFLFENCLKSPRKILIFFLTFFFYFWGTV